MPHRQELRKPAGLPAVDQERLPGLYREIQRARAKLVGPDGRSQRMPVSLEGFLTKVTAGLREGHSVAIVQDDAQLTTVEAARRLGVSRQFLIGQLVKGEMPFHMVGTHRRLYVRDVLAYRMRRDRKRHRILNDLTRAEAEEGLYDREPPDDRAN